MIESIAVHRMLGEFMTRETKTKIEVAFLLFSFFFATIPTALFEERTSYPPKGLMLLGWMGVIGYITRLGGFSRRTGKLLIVSCCLLTVSLYFVWVRAHWMETHVLKF